mgnify:FL=1
MLKTLRARLYNIEKGKVVIEAPILPTALQQQGYGHAGLTFALGDSAAGYSALTLLTKSQEVMTAEIKINFLGPAIGDLLRAEGKVLKCGKRLIVVTSEVSVLNGNKQKIIAVMQGTMVPVPI